MTPSALIVAGLLCLVGCAPPPPLLDISGHACTPAPELVGAASLALGDPLRPDVVKLTIDENSRCLQTADGKSLYGAFQLPDRPQPFMIAVRSAPAGDSLFVPRLLLSDGLGNRQREVPSDGFVFRGDVVKVLIRSHPNERFLVVASAPQAVGQTTSRITERTNTSVGCSGGGCFVIATGGDTQRTMIYARAARSASTPRSFPPATSCADPAGPRPASPRPGDHQSSS
jgi:hypothetical protein